VSTGDDSKTKKELLAEIEALKAELARQSKSSNEPTAQDKEAPAVPVTPILAEPVTTARHSPGGSHP
jgi:hypothetical protein